MALSPFARSEDPTWRRLQAIVRIAVRMFRSGTRVGEHVLAKPVPERIVLAARTAAVPGDISLEFVFSNSRFSVQGENVYTAAVRWRPRGAQDQRTVSVVVNGDAAASAAPPASPHRAAPSAPVYTSPRRPPPPHTAPTPRNPFDS